MERTLAWLLLLLLLLLLPYSAYTRSFSEVGTSRTLVEYPGWQIWSLVTVLKIAPGVRAPSGRASLTWQPEVLVRWPIEGATGALVVGFVVASGPGASVGRVVLVGSGEDVGPGTVVAGTTMATLVADTSVSGLVAGVATRPEAGEVQPAATNTMVRKKRHETASFMA